MAVPQLDKANPRPGSKSLSFHTQAKNAFTFVIVYIRHNGIIQMKRGKMEEKVAPNTPPQNSKECERKEGKEKSLHGNTNERAKKA